MPEYNKETAAERQKIHTKELTDKLEEKLDPETGTSILDENGKVIMEEMTALTNGIRFKLVPVFDITQ